MTINVLALSDASFGFFLRASFSLRGDEIDFIRIPSDVFLYSLEERVSDETSNARAMFLFSVARFFLFSLSLSLPSFYGSVRTQDTRASERERTHNNASNSDDEDEEGVSQKLHSRCPNFSVFPAGFVRTAGLRAIAGIFMLPWMS